MERLRLQLAPSVHLALLLLPLLLLMRPPAQAPAVKLDESEPLAVKPGEPRAAAIKLQEMAAE